jgi:hypothetical protein
LLFELEAHGALAEQRFRLIERVNGHGARLRDPAFTSGEGVGVAFTGDDEVGTVFLDLLNLGGRGDTWHENCRRNPEFH